MSFFSGILGLGRKEGLQVLKQKMEYLPRKIEMIRQALETGELKLEDLTWEEELDPKAKQVDQRVTDEDDH